MTNTPADVGFRVALLAIFVIAASVYGMVGHEIRNALVSQAQAQRYESHTLSGTIVVTDRTTGRVWVLRQGVPALVFDAEAAPTEVVPPNPPRSPVPPTRDDDIPDMPARPASGGDPWAIPPAKK
jgi:hypothetical protein